MKREIEVVENKEEGIIINKDKGHIQKKVEMIGIEEIEEIRKIIGRLLLVLEAQEAVQKAAQGVVLQEIRRGKGL